MDTILQSPVVVTASSGWGKRLAMLKRAPKPPTTIVLPSILVAIFAPVLPPSHSAIDSDLRARGLVPVFIDGGNSEYPLGTDRQRRDILSRIIVGARLSLSVAALSILVGGVVSTPIRCIRIRRC